jgi:hypothetical protein
MEAKTTVPHASDTSVLSHLDRIAADDRRGRHRSQPTGCRWLKTKPRGSAWTISSMTTEEGYMKRNDRAPG